MTTSQYGGLVAFDAARLAANEPDDAGLVNDGLLNGVAHIVDEQGQTLVAWMSPTSAQFRTWQYTPAATSSAVPTFLCCYDAASIHPRPNGKPPVFVVDLQGALAGNPGTVSFVVGIFSYYDFPVDGAFGPVAPAANVNAVTFNFTSSTPAWGTTTRIEYDSAHLADSLRRPFGGAGSIYARLSAGGVPISVDLLYTRIEVWAYSTGITTVPRLSGLVVREFCGPGA